MIEEPIKPYIKSISHWGLFLYGKSIQLGEMNKNLVYRWEDCCRPLTYEEAASAL